MLITQIKKLGVQQSSDVVAKGGSRIKAELTKADRTKAELTKMWK